jgi:hypothetical protein
MSRSTAFWSRFALVIALSIALGSSASAVNPASGSVTPPGARRGTDVEVTFGGSRLQDFHELMLYYPGITIKDAKAVNDSSVKATLSIAENCRPGQHAFRIVTKSGVSNLNLFYVGVLEEVTETEPNNEFAKPQPVELGSTINGTVAVEDIDYFEVTAKKGERITAEVEGIRLGRAFFDPYVAIFDKERFELSGSDDDALLWHDAVASIVAPEDGKYVIAVRESSFSVAGQYRLHVGRFPRPKAVMPAGGKYGSKVDVTWIGDKGGEFKESIQLPKERLRYSALYAPDNLYFPVFAKDAKGMAPSPVLFRLNDLENVIEKEPNNDLATATEFAPPMGLNGVIGEEGDTDFFKFNGKKGEVWEVNVHARSIGSPLDSVLTIRRGANGAQVAQSDDVGRPDSYLRLNIPADDVYTIVVSDLLRQGGPNYAYRVELTKVEPKLAITLPERQLYVDTTNTVFAGNRMAFMANIQRRDVGGDLKVELKNLPKGMTYEVPPVTANMNTVPVVIKAAADAPVAGALIDLTMTTVDPKVVPPVVGHVSQATMLVRGGNNRSVYEHVAEFMAASVGEKVPFRIEVEKPKIPLVRNGSMELKVKAIREGDFKGPIAVRFLYTPPGVSASGGVSIAEGQTEAMIPVTANANSEVKSWPLVIMAEANVGNGNALISSDFFNLDVAEAFFTIAFKPSAAEQGQEGVVAATLANQVEFNGKAKVELIGLPAESTAEPIEITKDSEEISFNVKTTGKTPPGKHKTLVARILIPQAGEQIVHMLGTGELRVDTPLPPKATKPNAAPAAAVANAPKPAAAKPLSRLEMLRKERESVGANNEKKQ